MRPDRELQTIRQREEITRLTAEIGQAAREAAEEHAASQAQINSIMAMITGGINNMWLSMVRPQRGERLD